MGGRVARAVLLDEPKAVRLEGAAVEVLLEPRWLLLLVGLPSGFTAALLRPGRSREDRVDDVAGCAVFVERKEVKDSGSGVVIGQL